MSVCNTYSGKDNFTTFLGVVYFAGLAFTGVDVCRMGEALKEELPDNFECSWPDSCKIKDNDLLQKERF